MSTLTQDQPAEQVFNKPTRRRTTRTTQPTTTDVAPESQQDQVVEQQPTTTGKRTTRRARVEVVNDEEKAPVSTAKKGGNRRKPVDEQPEEEPAPKPRRVVKKKEKEEPKTSKTLELLKEALAVYSDPSVDANGRRAIEKELVKFESDPMNKDIINLLNDLIGDINSVVWSTTKKRPVELLETVQSFLLAVDWGTAYNKANTKGKVQFTTLDKPLNELLYSINHGIANTLILNQLAKLYILLNPDISIPLAEGEKRTPQSFVKADDLMTQYLSGIMDELIQADEEYNAKIDEKGGNKKHKVVFDPNRIARQQVSKLFKHNSQDLDTEADDEYDEIISGLESDEKLLADAINFYEREKAAKAKAAKEEANE